MVFLALGIKSIFLHWVPRPATPTNLSHSMPLHAQHVSATLASFLPPQSQVLSPDRVFAWAAPSTWSAFPQLFPRLAQSYYLSSSSHSVELSSSSLEEETAPHQRFIIFSLRSFVSFAALCKLQYLICLLSMHGLLLCTLYSTMAGTRLCSSLSLRHLAQNMPQQ